MGPEVQPAPEEASGCLVDAVLRRISRWSPVRMDFREFALRVSTAAVLCSPARPTGASMATGETMIPGRLGPPEGSAYARGR
jgi:hypothetical protein